jgi:hypothetical protein
MEFLEDGLRLGDAGDELAGVVVELGRPPPSRRRGTL